MSEQSSDDLVRLREAGRIAEARHSSATIESIRSEIRLQSGDSRLQALMIGQLLSERGLPIIDLVEEARAVLRSDSDEDCQWQRRSS